MARFVSECMQLRETKPDLVGILKATMLTCFPLMVMVELQIACDMFTVVHTSMFMVRGLCNDLSHIPLCSTYSPHPTQKLVQVMLACGTAQRAVQWSFLTYMYGRPGCLLGVGFNSTCRQLNTRLPPLLLRCTVYEQ